MLALAHLGDLDAAGAQLDRQAAQLGALAHDPGRTSALVVLAEVALMCWHRDAADAVREALAGESGRFAAVGMATVTVGPVDRALGQCARVAGDLDAAVAAHQRARDLAERGGAALWGARSAVDLAQVLRLRDGPGDRDRATRLADDVARSGLARTSAWLARQLAATA
jgi:hypothetical protein